MDVSNLERQHKEIFDLVNYILGNIKSSTVERNVNEIVRNINTITGKLKIHLLNEDKYLYPKLLNSSDSALNIFGNRYFEEMKEVTQVYENYKSKYNTATKIKENIEEFNKETTEVFKVLANRIEKEEEELYPLLG